MTALRILLAAPIAALLLLTAAGSAQARPQVSTTTKYFTISGSSAREIVSSLMGQGHVLGGRGRVGLTTMNRKLEWTFDERKGRCRVKSQSTRLYFQTLLPRHSGDRRLPKRLRAQWRDFAAYVKRHEARHREIWLGCARRAERQVKRASAASCSALVPQLEGIYERVRADCDRRHDAFDRAETRAIGRHPLVRASAKR